MPRVTSVVSIPAIELETAWEAVSDFARYPATMRDVLAVAILDREGNAGRSAWRVLLNGSELTWTEEDRFHPMQRIEFDQIEGDLELFRGEWRLERMGDGVEITLDVEFDVGIPSLASVLNPIGIQAIRANSRQMLNAIKGVTEGAAR